MGNTKTMVFSYSLVASRPEADHFLGPLHYRSTILSALGLPFPHGFVFGNSRATSQWVTHHGIAQASFSLNFGVPTEPEASELPKGLVLGRDGNIHLRITPLGDVGCHKSDVPSYASPHDQNPVTGLVDYYGVLTYVFGIKYRMKRKVVLFKCNWFDGTSRNTGQGVKTDKYGFRLVNFNKILSASDPFIFASQALQVFYVQDPTDIEWHVAIKMRPRYFFDMSSAHDHDPCDRQDVEHATGDNDKVRVKSNVDAQDFEECL